MCRIHSSALSAQATTCNVGAKYRGTPGFPSFKATVIVPALRVVFEAGGYAVSKRLTAHAIKLWGDQGNLRLVAVTFSSLSDTNRLLDLFEEGIQLAKEALKISQQVKDTVLQTTSFSVLAPLFLRDNQVVAAEETASQAIAILSENSLPTVVIGCRYTLGEVYRVKRNSEEAIEHFKLALRIASSQSQHREAFYIYHSLVRLSVDAGKLDDANAHLERAKLYTANNAHGLLRTITVQAHILYRQGRIDEGKSECLRAAECLEEIGATVDAERCRNLYSQCRCSSVQDLDFKRQEQGGGLQSYA